MSSNSIRISNDLFALAREEGEVMSRSTAQQIEHWARMGAAMEASGASVAASKELVRNALRQPLESVVSEKELWAEKRKQQARDIENVRSGRVKAASMNWFNGMNLRRAKLVDSPY